MKKLLLTLFMSALFASQANASYKIDSSIISAFGKITTYETEPLKKAACKAIGSTLGDENIKVKSARYSKKYGCKATISVSGKSCAAKQASANVALSSLSSLGIDGFKVNGKTLKGKTVDVAHICKSELRKMEREAAREAKKAAREKAKCEKKITNEGKLIKDTFPAVKEYLKGTGCL